jgi:diguanylate cyclase (GGDEF)-like protein/PAS domain S-box-containing protein
MAVRNEPSMAGPLPMRILRLRIFPWLLTLGAVLLIALFSYVNGHSYLAQQSAAREALLVREVLADTLSLMKDAETGTRGVLLTDDPRFLEPYENALPRLEQRLTFLHELGVTDGSQRAAAQAVDLLTKQKLALLSALVELQRQGKFQASEGAPKLAQGKLVMDALRVEIARMIARVDVRLHEREAATKAASERFQLAFALVLIGGVGLASAGLIGARRDAEQARAASEALVLDIAAREQAEVALRYQTRLLESVLAHIGDGVAVIGQDREMLLVNPAAAPVAPYAPGESVPTDWSNYTPIYLPDGKTRFPSEKGWFTRALRGESSDGVEMALRVAGGRLRFYSVTTRPLVTEDGKRGAVAVYRDTTDLKLAQKEQLESEQRYRVLSEASFEGMAITRAGVVLDTNANLASWVGYEPHELVGIEGVELFAPEERERVTRMARDPETSYESSMLRRDGSRFPVEVRARSVLFRDSYVRVAVVRDVTEKKKQERELLEKSEQLRALSLRDELTGLYNRRGFIELAEHQLKASERSRHGCAVFYADLNGLKRINDELGHEVGDEAIRATAEILLKVFRSSDVVARLGGDEFAVFAPACEAAGVAASCARLEAAVAAFNTASQNRYRLSISTGASLWSCEQPRDLFGLMQAADAAMYAMKRARYLQPSLPVLSS